MLEGPCGFPPEITPPMHIPPHAASVLFLQSLGVEPGVTSLSVFCRICHDCNTFYSSRYRQGLLLNFLGGFTHSNPEFRATLLMMTSWPPPISQCHQVPTSTPLCDIKPSEKEPSSRGIRANPIKFPWVRRCRLGHRYPLFEEKRYSGYSASAL